MKVLINGGDKERFIHIKDTPKPCPFCGGEATLIVYDDFCGLNSEIMCGSNLDPDCLVGMILSKRHDCQDEPENVEILVDAWNRRVI